MKKNIITVGALLTLILSNNICSAMTKDQVKREYESRITSAFFKTGDMTQVKKTFYDYAIDSTALKLCRDAAAQVTSFVNDHSKNLIGVRDSLLINTASELEKLTNETIIAIKTTRDMRNSSQQLISQIKALKALETKCYNTLSKLEKEKFNIADKKESQEVLKFCLDILRALMITAYQAAELELKKI